MTAALERARADLGTVSGTMATDRPDLVTMPDDLSWKVDFRGTVKEIDAVLQLADTGRPASYGVMQELHDSEINASIESFFERRWTARLGDEMNGWEAEETLASFAEAEDWLAKKACEIYPESTFAKKHRPGLSLAAAIRKV